MADEILYLSNRVNALVWIERLPDVTFGSNRSFMEYLKAGEASSVSMSRAQNKALQLTAR